MWRYGMVGRDGRQRSVVHHRKSKLWGAGKVQGRCLMGGWRWVLTTVAGPLLLLHLRAFMAERCLPETCSLCEPCVPRLGPASRRCCALASKRQERGLTMFTFRFLNLELRSAQNHATTQKTLSIDC